MRPWYRLTLSSCSSALTSLPKHALLSFAFPLTLFFPPFGHYSEGSEVGICRVPPAHAAVSGWCLPLPDPQQELHCPSCCSRQRGIVLPTSPSRPAAMSCFIPAGDARRKAGCFLSVHHKVLGNRAGISPVCAEDEEARNLHRGVSDPPQTFLGHL